MTDVGAASLGESRDPMRWFGMGEVVRLSIPTVLSTLSYSLMQFADGWMVAGVGKEAFSAQLGGGFSAFVPTCFFIGLLGCVSTFASQNLGAGRSEQASRYGWQSLWLAWAAAVGLALLILPAPYLLGLFGHAPDVMRLETQYFQVLIGGACFNLTARALGAWFVGVHRPTVTFVAGVTANVVNLAANYLLIYGHWGFPRLGLIGAGIGTVVGCAVESLILGGAFVLEMAGREFAVRRACGFQGKMIRDLLRLGSPAGVMFMGDMLMWTLFINIVVGRFGTDHLAAGAILMRYWHLCFMPAIGVSTAVSAIVGRYCGAGQPRLAWRRAHAGLLLVEAYMVTMGLVIWLARDGLVKLFNHDPFDPVVQSVATQAVIFLLLCQAFDALNVIFIGALRGAGDTLWPGIVQLVLAYSLGLGSSMLVARLRPEWGSLGPWGTASAYVILLGLVMWIRFLSGKWRGMAVVEPSAAATGGAA